MREKIKWKEKLALIWWNYFQHIFCFYRSRAVGGLSRIWASSCAQNRLPERGRHRLSTVIQPLRLNAGEVVDLTVDEDGRKKPQHLHNPSISVLFT